MGTNQLYILLKKHREGRCTPEELEELNRWYEQFDGEADVMPEVPDEKLELLFGHIEQKIRRLRLQSRSDRFVRGMLAVVGIAAVVAVCFIVGRSVLPTKIAPVDEVATIRPGYNRAELILGDGSKIALDDKTVVKDKSGLLIKKDSCAVLDYTLAKGSEGSGEYNTISVPMGGEYGVILSDGTEIWLNSGSTLKYPVIFDGGSREVVLNGEGFFKVTKSSIPFIVKTFDLDIRVLGTSFNVSAYGNDESVQAALVDGSVMVRSNHDDDQYCLEPGHVLSYQKATAAVSVVECDTDLYTSWVSGEFKFRDMRLEDIMKKLNRWYECRINYADEHLKELRFSGAAEKDRPVEYVLELIKIVTDVDFEINGSTIVVKKR